MELIDQCAMITLIGAATFHVMGIVSKTRFSSLYTKLGFFFNVMQIVVIVMVHAA